MAKKLEPLVAPGALAATQQPYYLQRAHIKDFRSIRDAKVEFKPGLNIIIGPNGSGKTNFVRCIQNSLDKLSSSFNGDVELHIEGREELVVRPTKQGIAAANDLQNIDLYFDNKQRLIELSTDGVDFYGESFSSAHLKHRTELSSTNKFCTLGLIAISHGIPTPYSLVDAAEDFEINPRSIGHNNFENSLFVSALISSINRALLFPNGAASIKQRTLPTHKQVSAALNKVEKFYSEPLVKQLKQFTPIENLRFTASYNTYTNSSQQQVVVKGLTIDFKINNDWLPFSALSSGTQRLFYILSEIAASLLVLPIANLGLTITYDKIILLEEPELGIHPDQLHKLLLFLREQSKKHQIIITTHSPQVLDMLNEDELDRITICELHKTKGTQFRKLKSAQIATAKQYMKEQGLFLSDYWRYGNLEGTN